MIDTLKYIFSDIWICIGVIFLIYVIGEAFVEPICKAIITSATIKYSRNIGDSNDAEH